jgi:hypothetical protein
MSQRDLAAKTSVPVVCSLSASDQESRLAAWRELLRSGLIERVSVAGGIQLKPAPAAAKTLIDLIDLERECCAWIRFEIGPASVVTLTAPGEGEKVLAGMFVR